MTGSKPGSAKNAPLGRTSKTDVMKGKRQVRPKTSQPKYSDEWLEALGAGAFGKVVKLRRVNKRTGEEGLFAVKLIADSEKHKKQKVIEKEKRALSLLKEVDHENIVGYFGLLQKDLREELQRRFDNQPFVCFVFEFVAHGDLHTLMSNIKSRAEKRWEERSIFKIAHQVLEALDYLQSKSMRLVHNDIKPANIMLGPDLMVKLADFGLAQQMPPGLMEPIQHINKWAGTAEYNAPEKWNRCLAYASDIWSLGIILYEIVAGFRPYRRGDRKACILALQKKERLKGLSKQMQELKIEEARRKICREKVMNDDPDFSAPIWTEDYAELAKFVKKLLSRNWRRRSTAKVALHDPWMVKFGSLSESS